MKHAIVITVVLGLIVGVATAGAVGDPRSTGQQMAPKSAFGLVLEIEFAPDKINDYHRAIAECMNAAGFEWAALVIQSSASPAGKTSDALTALRRNDAYRRSLPGAQQDAFDAALQGTGPGQAEIFVPVSAGALVIPAGSGGCMGAARSKVFGELDVDGMLADVESSVRQAQAHPLTARAWSAWSECIGQSGFIASDFKSLIADFDRQSADLVAKGKGGTAEWAALLAERSRAIDSGKSCYASQVADVESRVRAEVESAIVAQHPELWATGRNR